MYLYLLFTYYYHSVFKLGGSKKLRTLSEVEHTTSYLPVHDIRVVEKQIIETLQAVHSLSSCNTTSKFRTKHRALMRAKKYAYFIKYFRKEDLSDVMLENAEKYLT